MKILRVLVVFGLAALSSHQALADAVVVDTLVNGKQVSTVLQPSLFGIAPLDDPGVTVHRIKRGSPSAWGVDDEFSFLTSQGSGVFDFFNDTSQTFHVLTLTMVPGGPPDNILTLFNCQVLSDFNDLPFSNCRFLEMGNSNSDTVVRFSGGPGLPSFSDFSIDLVGFAPGTEVSVQASPLVTPEPGSLALLLTGMSMLVGGRKLRKGAA